MEHIKFLENKKKTIPIQQDIVQKMSIFYNENKEKINALNNEHEINQENLQDWINDIVNYVTKKKTKKIVTKKETTLVGKTKHKIKVTWLDFALAFRKNLQYVSFTTFKEKLRTISTEISNNLIGMSLDQKNKKKIMVIMVIVRHFKKSNLWVSLLMWPTLKSYVTHIVSTPGEALYLMETEQYFDKVVIIHPDDCIYSGSQFDESFQGFASNLQAQSKEFVYYAATPYISHIALDGILEKYITNKTLTILKSSQRINSLYEDIKEEKGEGFVNVLFSLVGVESNTIEKYLFQWEKKSHAIYFEHKLADKVSTFNKLLALGPLRDIRKNEIILRPFISTCTVDKYSVEHESFEEMFDSLQTKFIDDFEKVCPTPFYKTIEYTYGRENLIFIENEDIVSVLSKKKVIVSEKIQSSINCRVCGDEAKYLTMVTFCTKDCYSKFH